MPKDSEPTPSKLWAFFIERVRANLHLVLCFSPVGEKFRQRARMFPGLINGCTVDWYLPWPAGALVEVATGYFASLDLVGGEAIKEKLIEHVAQVHVSVSEGTFTYFERYRRHVYVTPRSYLSFLTAYTKTYASKKKAVAVLAASIHVGLEKLGQAAVDVDSMKLELKDKVRWLAAAQDKSATLLHEITASTARAEKKKSEVQVVKDKAELEATAIDEQKKVIDAQLAEAKPALDEADHALKAITSKDISVLKQLKQPPNLIQRLFDCVLILLRVNVQPPVAVVVKERLQLQDSWREATPVMSQSSFLASILNFDRDKALPPLPPTLSSTNSWTPSGSTHMPPRLDTRPIMPPRPHHVTKRELAACFFCFWKPVFSQLKTLPIRSTTKTSSYCTLTSKLTTSTTPMQRRLVGQSPACARGCAPW